VASELVTVSSGEKDPSKFAFAIQQIAQRVSGGAYYKAINITRDMTAASASGVAYTGMGFKPKLILLLSAILTTGAQVWSIGFYDGTTNGCSNIFESIDLSFSQSAFCVVVGDTSTTFQTFTGTSLDADGFTGDWVKTGSPAAGTARITVVGFR
jgi:hypothetical protein